MMSSYDEDAMRRRISTCLNKVALVLNSIRARTIDSAEKVSHLYEDKFSLANGVTNCALACTVNCFASVGINQFTLAQLQTWSANKAVSLCFERRESCKLVGKSEREEENPSKLVKTKKGRKSSSIGVVTKVEEYEFLIDSSIILKAYSGAGDIAAESVIILERRSMQAVTSLTSTLPTKENTIQSASVDITWLLQNLTEGAEATVFAIDRSRADCHTPVQNETVKEALTFTSELKRFADSMLRSLRNASALNAQFACSNKVAWADLSAETVFNPVLPLVEQQQACDQIADIPVATQAGLCSLSPATLNQLVGEHRRSLEVRCTEVAALFSTSPLPVPAVAATSRNMEVEATADATAGSVGALFTAVEAKLAVTLAQVVDIANNLRSSLDFIESMVRAQLVAAIGKVVGPTEFSQYMTFHNRKVFKEQYQPKPFSYAVRRSPAHSPEGEIQIETAGVYPAEPICTVSQSVEKAPYMEFALNATTTVKCGGERHLHGWIGHRFSNQAPPALKLVTQARQFSSYIVLIGRIASAKMFQPKYGFIVQNKDEISIPLDLEQIPTAKEFKKAISSLSSEQQRFAKAFRSMQLESTLFGVCVIQIKPQLEKVLKLQADSLTKEIKLTQDLMQLFIKYQLPTDLLSYESSVANSDGTELAHAGAPSAPSAADRLLAVKKHVQGMQEMLLSAKEVEVAEQELQNSLKRKRTEKYLATMSARCSRSSSGYCSYGAEMVDDEGEDYDCYDEEEYVDDEDVDDVYTLDGCMGRNDVTASANTPSQSKQEVGDKSEEVAATAQGCHQVDYTKYPDLLEEMYTKYDPAASLRPTIINPGKSWTKRSQAGLLSTPVTKTLGEDQQAQEKNAAFDLLDALTRSGALPVEHASLHVIIAATHCFDQSLMDTVVKRNVNPIERVERSTLIMAAALNGVPAVELITAGQVERVSTFSPMLFDRAIEGVDSEMV